MRVVYFLFFIFSIPLSAAESQTKVNTEAWKIPAWKEWKKKYASSSPFMALNKVSHSSELKIPLDAVESVLQGKTKIQFALPRQHEGKLVDKVDLFNFASSRRLEVHDQVDLQMKFKATTDQAMKEDNRFQKMKDNLMTLISSRKKNELLLIQVGETHALDLYFSYFLQPPFPPNHKRLHWRNDVIYFANSRTIKTAFETSTYYQFLSYYDGVTYPEQTLERDSILNSSNYLSRLAYFRKLQPERFSKEKLTEEVPVRLGTLVFMDTHGLRSTDAISDLPGVASLKAAGLDSVTFVMEGQVYGKDFSEGELMDYYWLSESSIDPKDIDFFKKRRQKAYALLKTGFVADTFFYALHNKLKEYHKGGVKIRLTGVEPTDRIKPNPPTVTKSKDAHSP